MFETIFKFFLENQSIGGGIILILILLSYALAKYNLFGSLFTSISDYLAEKIRGEKKSNIPSIVKHHEIFSTIDFWMNIEIPKITYQTDFRTAVFRDYLITYFTVYKKKLYEFINSIDYKNIENEKLWDKLFSTLNSITVEFNKEVRLLGIPEIVIERMDAERKIIVDFMIETMRLSCFDNNYNNIGLKIYAILNLCQHILYSVMMYSQKVCDGINGALSGKKYKNFIEPKHK